MVKKAVILLRKDDDVVGDNTIIYLLTFVDRETFNELREKGFAHKTELGRWEVVGVNEDIVQIEEILRKHGYKVERRWGRPLRTVELRI